jgi:hypothetical protein
MQIVGGHALIGTVGLLLASAVVLAGCAAGGDSPMTLFADPSKYQYHNCEQLAAAAKAMNGRRQELRGLMDKAEQSTGGVVASTLAYRADYVSAAEELKVIDAAARNRNCDSTQAWQSNAVIR